MYSRIVIRLWLNGLTILCLGIKYIILIIGQQYKRCVEAATERDKQTNIFKLKQIR